MKHKVVIVVGSTNDVPQLVRSGMLQTFDGAMVAWEISPISAHRHRVSLMMHVQRWLEEDVRLFIAAASMSAALPGDLSSQVTPHAAVFGVALPSTYDPTGEKALASMLYMPRGVPVATMGVGEHALQNAAWLCCTLACCTSAELAQLRTFHKGQLPEPLPEYASSDDRRRLPT